MQHRTPHLITVATTILALVVGLLAGTLAAEHTSDDGEPASNVSASTTTTTSDPATDDPTDDEPAVEAASDTSDTSGTSGDATEHSHDGEADATTTDETSDETAEGDTTTEDATDEGGDTSDPPATSACDTGEFRHGRWHVDGSGGTPADLTGLEVSTVEGDPECMRLRLTFDGPVPGFDVESYSSLWETRVHFDGRDAPAGPVSPDFFRAREGELVDTALVVHDAGGLGVLATHGRDREVAARAVVGDGRADLYVRPVRDGDVAVDDIYEAEAIRTVVRGLPDRDGLGVTALLELSTGRLYVAGYAAAPESHVEVSVYDGPTEVCDRSLMAAGPMYLLSFYETTCDLDPGTYQVEIGWHSPTGDPADDTWYLDEVEIRS